MEEQDKLNGFVISSDLAGNINEILYAGLNIKNYTKTGKSFPNLVDSTSIQKALQFIKKIRNVDKALNWELNLSTDHEITVIYCSGFLLNDKILIFGAPTMDELAHFIEDLRNYDSESYLYNFLKNYDFNLTEQGLNDIKFYEDVSHLNNELINTKRELTKSNIQMVKLIEKLKKQTQLAEDKEEEFRNFFESSMDAVLLSIFEGPILRANPAAEKMFGYTEEEICKLGIDGLAYKQDPDLQDLINISEQKSKVPHEYYFIRKDRTKFLAEISASIYKDKVGNKRTSIIIRDITEYKKAEEERKRAKIALRQSNANIERLLNIKISDLEIAEIKSEKRIDDYGLTEIKLGDIINQLKTSNKELEQFAYVASHDLREPLRMITTFLQLLERKYKDQLDQDANEFIEFAVDGAERLDHMIEDLLKYSKINNNQKILSPLNLEKVVEKTLINLKIPIDENNAIITHDPLPTIKGDEQSLIQLYQNLISNAIKYQDKETPKIHISAIKENNQYMLSVKDNGIGIDQKHLERIFTMFQRLHAQDEYGGTGIGLAISEKIVQQHGGKIWGESEPGIGTTFYFTIPIKAK